MMDLETIIGITYSAIGAAHLVVYVWKNIRQHKRSEPMECFVAVFAWPLVDAVWVLKDPRKP